LAGEPTVPITVAPERLGPLAGDQADTAGRSLDQHGIARLHAIGLAQQVGGRQALQHHGRTGVERNGLRQNQQPMRRKLRMSA
jgi:hypothetical protein